MRADPALQFWEGDTKPIGAGLTLVRLGGHFEGRHRVALGGLERRSRRIASGDILQVVPSRHVSFMWSYPNLIPLSAAKVRRIAEDPRAIPDRRDLRCVFGPRADRCERQRNSGRVGRALHCTDQRQMTPTRMAALGAAP